MKDYVVFIVVIFLVNSSYSQKTSKISKDYQKLEDSVFSIEKTERSNELQLKYQTEKKDLKIAAQESNIALLEAKNKIKKQWMLFGGAVLLTLFFIVIVYKSRNSVKKEKKQQEQFSQDLIQYQEEERKRIARELHDSIGQQLTLMKRKSQNLGQEEITRMIDNTLEEVRSISRNVYPTLLKELGLTESIEQLINEYGEQTDLFFSTDIDQIDTYLTDHTSLNFYRLVQECLTNIIKHAKAKAVTIHIKKQHTTIIALISDNGKGFNINDAKKKNGLGLKTIFERIKIVNGKISITSTLGIGTSFTFFIPVKNESYHYYTYCRRSSNTLKRIKR